MQQALAESGLAPQRLEIEITERIIMEDTERTLSNLRRLKELGVRIAMDDFGTGYSSLSYLRRFPFDKIKVDRTFVSDLAEGTEHVVIVQAVVSIARALGLTTTAEGVEIGFQRDYLKALGYDEAQGYLFSPAVPIEQVPALIARMVKQRGLDRCVSHAQIEASLSLPVTNRAPVNAGLARINVVAPRATAGTCPTRSRRLIR